MTGYAVATSEGAAGTLTIEIKSVNSRFLDLQFRINDDLRALEPDLRAAAMSAKIHSRNSGAVSGRSICPTNARVPAAKSRSSGAVICAASAAVNG